MAIVVQIENDRFINAEGVEEFSGQITFHGIPVLEAYMVEDDLQVNDFSVSELFDEDIFEKVEFNDHINEYSKDVLIDMIGRFIIHAENGVQADLMSIIRAACAVYSYNKSSY